MRILGINEGFDSSVVVLENGRIVFALQEERVTREKNGLGFPENALKFTMKQLNLYPGDFDKVCLSNLHSPIVTKAAFHQSYNDIANAKWWAPEQIAKKAFQSLKDQMPEALRTLYKDKKGEEKNRIIEEKLFNFGFKAEQLHRSPHHFNHAAAVYYGLRKNSHEPHLVFTLDGGGDRVCAQVYIAKENELKLVATTPDGHSIGNIYSRVTHFMGMTPHEHEYKLMGLAAYMKDEKYVRSIVDTFRSYLDLDPANPMQFLCKVPEKTYAIQPRLTKDFQRVRFDNLASGLQVFTEELMVKWVKKAIEITGIHNVLGSGGVFMNVKANKKIAELPEVKFFDVFPSCGDETLPFGAAWSYYAQHSPTKGNDIVFDSFYLGPDAGFDLEEAKKKFANEVVFETVADPHKKTAELLADGQIVGRCSGPMEFGARALGNRSILSDPARTDVVPEINKMIKQRDFWMPFAPAMLVEKARRYVNITKSLPEKGVSPYMMHTFDTTDLRGDLVAGTHQYDHTARAQMICPWINPAFHDVVSKFDALTGRAVVLNTSFNLHGYPIVMGACDAIDVMLKSSMKYLMINDQLITKK